MMLHRAGVEKDFEIIRQTFILALLLPAAP